MKTPTSSFAVELFTIQCTTCKARLAVKDESVIGEILSCPKCHSMVQVVPPVGWKRPGGSDRSPEGLSGVGAAASQLPSPTAEPRESAAPVKASAAAAIPALPPRPPTRPASAVSQPGPGLAAATTPAPSWFAIVVARARRDWIMLTGGLAGGIVLGAVVWLVVVMPSSEEPWVADRTAQVVSVSEPSLPAEDGPPPKNPELVTPPAKSVPPESAVPDEAPRTDKPPPAAPITPAAPEADEPPVAAAAPAKPPSENASPEREPALKLEPIRSPANQASRTIAEGFGIAWPDESALSQGNDPGPRRDEPDEREASAERQLPAAAAAAPALSLDEIDKRLSTPLAQVEFADVPLEQFVAFVADLTSVPVVVDEAALARIGRGRRMPVTIKLSDTTSGDALRAAVQSVGLSLAIGDGKIVVTAGAP